MSQVGRENESVQTENKDYRWTFKQTMILFAFIFVVIGIAVVILILLNPPGKRSFSISWVLGLALLSFLMIRFRNVEVIFTRFVDSYLRFSVMMLVAISPIIGFSFLTQFVLDRLPLWAQIVVFSIWGALLTLSLLQIATKTRRDRLLTKLKTFSLGLPFAYSFVVLAFALQFFSSVTFVIKEHDLLVLKGQNSSNLTPGNISDFYLWHFLESIPVLKVNSTLKWKEPITYDSTIVGWLLLLFKTTVVVPVIAAFAWYWKYQQPAKA